MKPGTSIRNTSGIAERVAEVDEARGLVGGVVVEDAAELLGLVGDDPRRAPAEAREAGDDRLRPLALHVEVLAVVDDRGGSPRTCHTACGWTRAARRAAPRRARSIGSRDRPHAAAAASQFCGMNERYCLMRSMHSSSSATSMSPTPDLRQCTREPPSSSWVTSSPTAARTRCGPGERHRAAALDHRHEVGEAGDVGGAGGARPHQRGDLRDHAAHHDLLAEQVPGAGEQRADGLLDARAGGVEQPDERDPLGQRQLAQARDLQLAGHPHRAGHHREVVGAHGDQPAVDLAVAGDHAVGGRVHAVHRALGEVRAAVDAELDERALVDQQREALARGELLLLRAGGRSSPRRRRA